MPLRVLVFNINGRGESSNCVAIDRAQLFVHPAILFRALRELFEQTMRVNTDANVPDHGANRVKVVGGKLFATCLSSEQDQASYFATHNHRQHQLNSFMNELLAMSIQKRVRARSVCDKKLCDVV